MVRQESAKLLSLVRIQQGAPTTNNKHNMKKKKPNGSVEVKTKQLVKLVVLASNMASDLADFGSENADYYIKQIKNWKPS